MAKLNLVVTSETTDQVHSIVCESTDTVAHVVAIVATKVGVNGAELVLLHDGTVLSPSVTLAAARVADNDVLIVRQRQRRPQQQPQPQQQAAGGFDLASILSNALQQTQVQHQGRSQTDPRAFRQQMLSDPHSMAMLAERNPPLADAVRAGDLATIERILAESRSAQLAQQRELQRLQEDPFNVENQRRIEELIQQQQINENYENAVEHNPAAFGRVVMLYIDCKVNNVAVKAFVDSGAQMTIMSPKMARQVNIFHLIDRRFQGTAVGVGEQRIIGRVHMAPLTIGGESYPCTVTVLERDDMDFLLGLDMLKAHRAIIDLMDNVLRIGSVTTPFLGEADIPRGGLGRTSEQNDAPPSSATTTTTTTTTSAPPQQRTLQQSVPEPPEAMIATLVNLGATREEAIQLLRAANNNVDIAAGMMF
jgi:DNA damage-inducible protein 1